MTAQGELQHAITAMRCDIDVRKDLFANIILSGGNTMFEGLAERLAKAVRLLAPSSTKVAIRHLPKLGEEEGALRGYGYGVATDIAEVGGLSVVALG